MSEISESTQVDPAEVAKSLGNDAYNAKNYDLAIEHYSEAIRLNPDNAVYYSNRSVCYASKKDWKLSLDDANECVTKDPNFIKGYFRKATAEIELQLYSEAELTLAKVDTISPENDQTHKLKRYIRTKRAPLKSTEVSKKPAKQLDEAQKKEFMDLQEQLINYNRELRLVNSRISKSQHEVKLNQVTTSHVNTLTEDVPVYRSVGKSFILSTKPNIEDRLQQDFSTYSKNLRELVDQREYLDKRIANISTELKDLTAGM